jgi:hypothetical protein
MEWIISIHHSNIMVDCHVETSLGKNMGMGVVGLLLLVNK